MGISYLTCQIKYSEKLFGYVMFDRCYSVSTLENKKLLLLDENMKKKTWLAVEVGSNDQIV